MQYSKDIDNKLDMGVSVGIFDKKMQILHVHMPRIDYHQTVEIDK